MGQKAALPWQEGHGHLWPTGGQPLPPFCTLYPSGSRPPSSTLRLTDNTSNMACGGYPTTTPVSQECDQEQVDA